MSDPLADAADQIATGQRRQAQARAIAAVPDDPEEAARARQLGQATGVPPTAIYGDDGEFENALKSSLQSKIIENNTHLQDYINADPMHAKLSNDDWHNLDEASSSIKKLGGLKGLGFGSPMGVFGRAGRPIEAAGSVLGAGVKGAYDTMTAPYGEMTEKRHAQQSVFEENIAKLFPGAERAVQAGEYGVEGFMRLVTAGLEGVGAGTEELIKQFGGSEQTASSIRRDTLGIIESRLMDIGAHAPKGPGTAAEVGLAKIRKGAKAEPDMGQQILRQVNEAWTSGKPWIAAGKEPPPGVHPIFDMFHEEQAKRDAKNLDDAFKAVQGTETFKRAPEVAADFVRLENTDKISISANKIRELYGDTEPSAEDGKLGWVPGLVQQLDTAAASGGYIEVPLADWLTKASPEIHKELIDFAKVRPNGITVNEAKGLKSFEPLAMERQSTALERARGQPNEEELLKFRIGQLTRDATASRKAGVDVEGQGYAPYRTELRQLRERLKEVQDPAVQEAEEWQGYHGTTGPPFKEFDPNRPTTRGGFPRGTEKGTVFFSPTPDLANQFAFGEGARIIKAKIKPGKTADFDALKLWKEDEKFHEELRDLGTQYAARETTPADRVKLEKLYDERHQMHLDEYQRHQEATEEARKLGAPEEQLKEWKLPLSTGALGAIIERAKKQGLDTFRVTGLREGDQIVVLNPTNIRMVSPEVDAIRSAAKLDPLLEKIPEGWTKVSSKTDQPVYEGPMIQITDKVSARMLTEKELTPDNLRTIAQVTRVLDRIIPNLRRAAPVAEVFVNERKIGGVYQQFVERLPLILWSLDRGEGVARHEAIHHLRNYGFFKDNEWAALEKTALREDWIGKHKIDERYRGKSIEKRLEESIAEEFRKWSENPEQAHTTGGVFEKLKALLDRVKSRLTELLGYEPTARDLFLKVEKGEIGARKGRPIREGAFDPQAMELPEGQRQLFEKGSALGVSQKTLKNILRLINERDANDVERQTQLASRDIKRRQTKEWKENEAKVLAEVAQEIKSRPDIAADRFFREGILPTDAKLEYKPRLDSSKLTEEQKAELHPHSFGKDGLAPDDIAGTFGYQSGEAMINRLRMLEQARKTEGASPGEYLGRLISDETERRMQEKYGDLAENILNEAMDHVISPTEMDKLHEEYMMVGQMVHGENFKGTFTKEDIKAFAKQVYARDPISKMSKEQYLRAAGKAAQRAIDFLADEDPTQALKALQERNVAMALANEAKRYEKKRAQLDKTADQFKKREVKGYDQQFTNFMHDILRRVGYGINRSIQDLQAEIAKSPYKNLEGFYFDKTEGELLKLPIPEFLFDQGFSKKTDDLTGTEFDAVHQAIMSMKKLSRDSKLVDDRGMKRDFGEVLNEKILPQMERLPEQIRPMQERGVKARTMKWLRVGWAAHLGWETIANRFALDDPLGAWNRMLVYPLADASLYKNKLVRHFSKVLDRIPKPDDPNKLVEDHPFKDPFSRTDLNDPETATRKMAGFTKNDWLGALQNAGNPSSLDKMLRGWGIKEEEFWPALFRNTTKEDWDRAQKIGDVFDRIKRLAERRDRELFGISPERIDIKPVETPYGTFKGWYHEVRYRSDWAGTSQKLIGKDVLEQEGFFSASGKKSWEKTRTGYAAPVDLSFDHVPTQIDQMLHDLAFREPIIQTQKFFRDPKFRNTLTKHFGVEYTDGLMPYLKSVANQSNVNSMAEAGLYKLVTFLRANTIGNLIGFNPSTFLKHGPTAAALSMKEVGLKNFASEFVRQFGKDPETAEWMWQWAHKKFGEIAFRARNYQETIYGAGESIAARPAGTFMTMRDLVSHWGSAPVAASDMASAVPTAIAMYKKVMQEGIDHSDYGKLTGLNENPALSGEEFKKLDAIATTLADRAVRRAHGSTAITNKAAVLRGNPLAQQFTSIYNFFSDILQRRYENAWKAKEAGRTWKEGEHKEAMNKFVGDVLPGVLAYWVLPGVIEELVTSRFDPEDKERKKGFGERLITGALHTALSSFVGVRDLIYGFQPGHETQLGILSSTVKAANTFKEDLYRGHAFDKANLGKTMEHTNTLLGGLTGLTNAHVGKFGRAMYDYSVGVAHPRSAGDWWKLFETGTEKRGRHR